MPLDIFLKPFQARVRGRFSRPRLPIVDEGRQSTGSRLRPAIALALVAALALAACDRRVTVRGEGNDDHFDWSLGIPF